jgi:hypothetical protein
MDHSLAGSWEEEMNISTTNAMRTKEESSYLYANYYKPSCDSRQPSKNCINIREDLGCREKICQWTFSVIDHFGLSRQTVSISIDLFDRFFATRGNRSDTDLALLTSLTTLYIAIKVNEKKKIKLSTLARLSRQQFTPKNIEDMEMVILKKLSWFVHPPTAADFISQLVMMLPDSTSSRTRHTVFELSRYNSELAVCDPYFIEHHKSSIALATILNALEDDICYEELPLSCRETFLYNVTRNFDWFSKSVSAINRCRDRLRQLKWEQEKVSANDFQKRAKRARSPTSILSQLGNHA